MNLRTHRATSRKLAKAATLIAYIATIPAANWLIAHYGAVPVGFGLVAPAGVFMAAAALVLRDALSELASRWTIATAISAGAALSWWLATPALAVASAAAFAIAELADWAIYARLRRQGRGALAAVLASNTIGLAIDSWLFLYLAYDGSMEYLPGQLLAKTEMTLAALAVIAALQRRRTEAAA